MVPRFDGAGAQLMIIIMDKGQQGEGVSTLQLTTTTTTTYNKTNSDLLTHQAETAVHCCP